jgi:signal transduction histidine kinase
LAIVKEIIEAHGSRVEVTSQPGKGTRFTFTLNVADRFAGEVRAT